jgi:hypothetical protein
MTIEIYIAMDRLAEYEALKNSARSEDQRIFAMLEKAAARTLSSSRSSSP